MFLMLLVLVICVIPVLVLLVLGLAHAPRSVEVWRSDGLTRRTGLRSLGASALATLVALAATVLWMAFGPPTAPATLPALAAAVGILAAAALELTWRAPRGTVRTASLGSRSLRPSHLRVLVATGFGGSILALVVGSTTAAPDGRSVSRRTQDIVATAGPYPGSAYALPVAVALAALGIATWWALQRVDARPSLGAEHEELDRALRRVSEVRVLRFASAGSLLTAAGLWLTLGLAVNRVTQNLRMNDGSAPRSPGDWVQNLGFAGTGFGVLALVLCLVALCWQAPTLPRRRAATASPATRTTAEPA